MKGLDPLAAPLLVVFVLAKAAMVADRDIPLSAWSPLALLWHDLAVVLAFAVIALALGRRRRMVWMLYLLVAAYAAVNVPVARALSTPLTWPMLRAAGGPLADSILHYATWSNLTLVAAILGAAIALPYVSCRFARRGFQPVIGVIAVLVALGPLAAARVDTRGFERSAWTALVLTAFPHVTARHAGGEWRESRLDLPAADDLSTLASTAAGHNVVLVSLESTAAQYLGVYGATPDVMPNLSELARPGLVFEHAYAVYPESIKGLFSILCSTYPAFDSGVERYSDTPCHALPAAFADAGYRTGLFHSGRFAYLGMEAVIRHRGYDRLEDAGDIGGNHESSFGVDESATVDRMLAWVDSLAPGERFFLTYLPIAGHHPYETPERGPFPDHDEIGRYRNALRYGDAALGRLSRGLAARGLDRQTLWIILGDHGEAFNQHDGNYGHTFQLYDENVRVPFIIAAPGLCSRQVRVRRVVSLIDTAPTVLALVGLPVPSAYQGSSMLDPEPRAALFFTDYSLGLVGVRDGPMKLIHDLGSGRSRLFDTVNDPREMVDISRRYPQHARAYERQAKDWSAAQKQRLLN